MAKGRRGDKCEPVRTGKCEQKRARRRLRERARLDMAALGLRRQMWARQIAENLGRRA